MQTTQRRKPIERARARYADNPHAAYEYPELPQAADAAFNFYAVYLAYPDGTVLKGPHPSFLQECESSIVADEGSPFVDHGIEVATNAQQQAILENLRPKLARDESGKPITLPTRRWRSVANKNHVYYEDPRVTAKKAEPFVRRITLYCPLKERGDSGALEDHGPYLGANAETPEDYDAPLGVCERCASDPDRQQRALVQIAELFDGAREPRPGPLNERLLGKQAADLHRSY